MAHEVMWTKQIVEEFSEEAMLSDFENIDAYIKTRNTPYGLSFENMAKMVCGKRQKAQLRKLINFKFKQSDLVNLPNWRLQAIEEIIQNRVNKLLKE